MTDHRSALMAATAARNDAQRRNAKAENAGRSQPFDAVDLEAHRLAVDEAAKAARRAGVDISDLVGDNVGRLEP